MDRVAKTMHKPPHCMESSNQGYNKKATVLQELRARRVNDPRYAPANIAENALSSVAEQSPGPLGNKNHGPKCDAANNPQVKAMIAKGAANVDPIIDGSIRKRLGALGKEEAFVVKNLQQRCLGILPSDRARFIDASGGAIIPLKFKERCDLQGYFDAEANKATTSAKRKIAAGEFFSTIMGKLLSAEWPDAVDFCASVCRSNERGTAVTRCVIGCAETTMQNCWSQCSMKACKSGCRRTHWWHWRKLFPCISHCSDICTYE